MIQHDKIETLLSELKYFATEAAARYFIEPPVNPDFNYEKNI